MELKGIILTKKQKISWFYLKIINWQLWHIFIIFKNKLYIHIHLAKILQETHGFGLKSWNIPLARNAFLKEPENIFHEDANFSFCYFLLGRLGMLIFCSLWATWLKIIWPLLHSGVKEAVCINTCMFKRPSSKCSSSLILLGRQHREWSE